MPKKDSKFANSPLSQETTRRGFLRRLGGFMAGHWLLSTLSIGGISGAAIAEYDTLDLRLEKWDLFYPALPQALDGKTIVQLSDLHLESLQIPPAKIEKSVRALHPDLLVNTGDTISARTDLDKLNEYLGNLNAPMGQYIVMGNNDYSHFSHTLFERYLRELRQIGWHPLLNDAAFLPDQSLWIIGVDDPATAHDDVAKAYSKVLDTQVASKQPFRLVLAHSTDCLDDVSQYGADLLLTGHTHGGQIRLPGLKPFLTNTYLGDKGIYEGYHVIENVPLYISRGIGESVIPLRFNVPPEIASFTLHRGSGKVQHQEMPAVS